MTEPRTESESHRSRYSPRVRFLASKTTPPSRSAFAFVSFSSTFLRVLPET